MLDFLADVVDALTVLALNVIVLAGAVVLSVLAYKLLGGL